MKYTLTVLVACLVAMILLTGCKETETGFFGSGGSSFVNTGSGSDGTGGTGTLGSIHMPEPTTIALLGSGLLAYALFRRKKKQ